ncbi:MAG: penicillin acylase family protein [Alphaproteobacteria bacterium]|nr:penicillin acylase family protein [Alphaproteobacteria bacterium]
MNFKKWLVRVCLTIGFLGLAGMAFLYMGFRASLPQLDGRVQSSELRSSVKLERDYRGYATLTADYRNDLSYSTGYLHGQERFFQMDLSRRLAAGELSELFGGIAIKTDMANRLHRFRNRAVEAINALPKDHKELLEKYVAGVNAGLNDLGSKPFEYWLLGVSPKPWSVEDSFLVIYSMFFTLQDSGGGFEWQNHLIKQSLDPALSAFLLPDRTKWDAPIQQDEKPLINTSIPPSSVLPDIQLVKLVSDDDPMPGSNNWAVSGDITRSGAAMLSNDMHLSIRAPSIWYKLRLKLNNGSLDVTGVSLPGTPAIVVGSNGSVAWGFTNSNIDTSDIIKLKLNPQNENQYLTADGYKDFEIYNETINEKGGAPIKFSVKETIWGPVMDLQEGETYVFRWVAHVTGAVNMGLLNMENVKSVQEAQSYAGAMGIPAQNAILADKDGNIGWTIFGMLPRRGDGDYSDIMDWSTGDKDWSGWYSSEEFPKVFDPDNHRLWTANGRVASGTDLEKLGSNRYDLGARAQQIRDDLFALDKDVVEEDLYNIMLDNRAVLLSRWQQQLLTVLKNSGDSAFEQYIREIENWGGKADKNSVGFRLVRDYRRQVYETLMGSITAPCVDFNEKCNYDNATRYWERPLWQLVTEMPDGWLPAGFDNWQFFFEKQAFDAWKPVIVGDEKLEHYTWGEQNRANIKHPLSAAVPLLGLMTDMPMDQQSGDTENMPHISGQFKGQSERIVVSPGFEERAIMNLPAGQSGHPLSPYYGAGHEDWVKGNPTPFLPQETKWTLEFMPLNPN